MKVSLESEKIRLGEERTHLASLDGIRGLTALMLIVLHYATAAWSFDPPYIPLPFPYPMDELTQFMYRGVWGGVGVATFSCCLVLHLCGIIKRKFQDIA